MTGITKKQYNEAEAKIEELLPLVDDETPTNDPNYIELMRFSDIVEAYELEHYSIEKLKAMGEKVKNNPLRFKHTAQEIRDLNRRREVDLSLEKGTITLKPIIKKPSLSELLCKVTEDNIHDETDTGSVVGKEDDVLIAFSNVREADKILSKSEKTDFIDSLKSLRRKHGSGIKRKGAKN